MRVARLHRVIARFYEQALQAAGGSHHPHQRRRPGQAGGAGREADAGAVDHQPERRPYAEKRLGRRGRDFGHRTSDVRDDYRRRQIR
jgi:hypothetical protein